ncbi:MAG: hypothetical protein HY819_19865 [Acidobacteria bacterium]|nr:hypothetical protein [Acidobacteriota bacterium]
MASFDRLKLKNAECISLGDNRWHLKVTVSIYDEIHVGEAISHSEDNNFEAMAVAALNAVSPLLPPTINLTLADAGQTYSHKTELGVFIVVIQLQENNRSKYISGSSLVALPIMHTPVKAVFSAINRTLTKYLPEKTKFY